MVTRRKGEYVPLSLTYMDDDALLSCSPLAELLFVRMLAVAGQLKTDGYLTQAQIVHRAGTRLGERRVPMLLAELVAAGPVLESDGGYRIRAWLEWNKSAEELRRDKAKDAERKRAERTGQAPDDPDRPPGVQAVSGWTDDDVQPDSERTPAGLRAESERCPASRAPTRAGHGTALHDTELTAPTEPRGELIPLAAPVTAQTLVAEWIEHCTTRPPGRMVGQVAKLLGEMLGEGLPATAVRAGLAQWHLAAIADANGRHPATLPSFVHAAANHRPAATSTTDQRVAAGLALAAKYAELDAREAQS